MIRLAINGFGRIGRTAFKIAIEKFPNEVEIVGINDLTDAKTAAYLLKHDSNYGIWSQKVSYDENNIIVNDKKYPVTSEKDPEKLPWKDLSIDVVIESSGRFTDSEGARKHLNAGAKKVIISAPVKDGDSSVKTFVLGVNGGQYSGEQVVSNASCTTNCIAPVAEVMNLKFGVAKAMMTTIHAYTQDQNLQDGPHKDLRRARAAAQNIVPTTTGAAIATTETIPALKGLFDGQAIRVPVSVGSISDFTFLLKTKVTVEQVNQAFKEITQNPLFSHIIAVSDEPLVSSDIIGRSESAIVDLSLTQVVDGDMVKIFAWYDNEFGYSSRLVEQVIHVGKFITP